MKQKHRELATEILQNLLLLGKTETMKGIYGRIAPAADGCVHSDQSPYGTETSRFSHAKTFLFPEGSTNLANLPKKTASLDPLYNVRHCIIPHKGRKMLKADYSAAEARWCAYIAGDSKRIHMYEQGIDQYKYFVAVLKWDDEARVNDVTKMERNAIGKVGILSGQYKVSWRTLLHTVNSDADITGIAINAKTAKKMEAIWPDLFPETPLWWQRVEDQVLSKGYLVNPFGFRRDFFARSDSEYARAALVREGIAFLPQSANAFLLNKALRKLYETYDPSVLRMLLQVHDEIVFDCSPRAVAQVVRLVKEVMEQEIEWEGRKFVIPAEIEVCGKNWADAKKIA